ncbi:hypothetical protein [Nocardia sp. NPDC057030]|uniref:hypothetical protein n=1 Tax=unclassified Nocardia TaxID=2637762 RepID=UPI00363077B9
MYRGFRLAGAGCAVAAALLTVAPSAMADPEPRLEKVSPAEISVKNDHDCFTAVFKGSGFMPGKTVDLRIGTDAAMGALRGDTTTAVPDQAGNFESSFNTCGLTTHGSTFSDHTCTKADYDVSSSWYSACKPYSAGIVVKNGTRWVSRKVVVNAEQTSRRSASDIWDDMGQVEIDQSEGRISEEEAEKRLDALRQEELGLEPAKTLYASVAWPLKITGKP